MDWNDPSYERLNVARTLIDNLPSNSKIGLVRFDGDWPKTEALTKTFTTDKEEVKNYLTRTYFYSPGGTDMYNGIQKAFPLYESTESTTLKMMIVLSDGETDDTYLHSSVVNTANNSNIRIYTVGLGSSTSYFNNYLKPLANNTGAAFYNIEGDFVNALGCHVVDDISYEVTQVALDNLDGAMKERHALCNFTYYFMAERFNRISNIS